MFATIIYNNGHVHLINVFSEEKKKMKQSFEFYKHLCITNFYVSTISIFFNENFHFIGLKN